MFVVTYSEVDSNPFANISGRHEVEREFDGLVAALRWLDLRLDCTPTPRHPEYSIVETRNGAVMRRWDKRAVNRRLRLLRNLCNQGLLMMLQGEGIAL